MPSVYNGRKLTLSVFGESHGEAIGVVIDGFPAGMRIDNDALMTLMKRRAPGGALATARKEPDIPRILSGVSDGYTNGFPICAVIENTNQRSSDYGKVTLPRPNHADYPALLKYGEHTELHGGGHFSGRLTAPLTFVGGLCAQYLKLRGVTIGAHIKRILNVSDSQFSNDISPRELEGLRKKEIPTLDPMASEAFTTIINSAKMRGDSVGAVIECAAVGLPAALGEHMFGSVESAVSELCFAIPGVKGIEFGAGFDFAKLYGSQANDAYFYKNGKVMTRTNNCGGIAGGMTTGMPLVFSVAMKPTPSIFMEQDTVDLEKQENAKLSIKGRHDPCIALRAVPVVESVAAAALADLMLGSEPRKL